MRRSTFSQINLERRELLVNDGHKLLFEIQSQVALPASCGTVGKIRATNFEQLFLMADGACTGPTVHELWGQGLDFKLDTRVADFYLKFWSLSLNKETSAAWHNELCRLATCLNEEQLIVHGDHLLRMKGDMVNEFKCAKEQVTTKAVFKAEGEKCLNHLPVIKEDWELAYMAPLTRL